MFVGETWILKRRRPRGPAFILISNKQKANTIEQFLGNSILMFVGVFDVILCLEPLSESIFNSRAETTSGKDLKQASD